MIARRVWTVLWPDPVLRLEAGTKVAVIARSGGGKTTLLQFLLQDVPSVVVADSKLEDEWAGNYETTDDPDDVQRIPRVVLRVAGEWLRDKTGWADQNRVGWNWTAALLAVLERRNTVFVADEAGDTMPLNGHDSALRIYRVGRALGVSAFAGSQYARNIGTHVLESAVHLLCGHMATDRDLDVIEATRTVDPSVLRCLSCVDEHGRGTRQFAYHHNSWHRGWRVFEQIRRDRPGRLEEARFVPTPDEAERGAWGRLSARRRAWWRRTRLPLMLWAAGAWAALGRAWAPALLLAAIAVYLVCRRWRARQWRVVVECGEPRLGNVVLAMPQRNAVAERGRVGRLAR